MWKKNMKYLKIPKFMHFFCKRVAIRCIFKCNIFVCICLLLKIMKINQDGGVKFWH